VLGRGRPTGQELNWLASRHFQAEARRLEGKRARFRVVLDSAEDFVDHSWDCLAPDGLHATVYLRPDQEAADMMTVEARLVIIDYPAGFGFPPLREYRLRSAVRVGD
jgi:hypothetical protein